MATFTYIARDDSGALHQGSIQAATELEASRQIRREGRFLVKLEQARAGAARTADGAAPAVRRPARFSDKYRPDDLIYFTNQLAVMVETGVSLAEALDACVHDGNSPAFARALQSVIDEVTGGSTFSAALAAHPRIFPVMYVNLIKASEASGTMGAMLARLADYLEHQRDLTKKIKGAVTYPIVMIFFSIGVTIFLMTFVLPRFASIYAGREDKLPTLTRMLMAFSTFLVDYGLYVVAGLVAAGVGLFIYSRTPAGMAAAEMIKFRVPLIGPLFEKSCLARSLRTLGTMIQSGVSILEGVELTAGVTGSLRYRNLWTMVNKRLETGQQLSEALADQPQIPKVVNRMLSAGERGGRLGPVMERVANFCESELNAAIKALTSLLEPAIVMFLGVVVGGLVLALLLPIFTISKAMH